MNPRRVLSLILSAVVVGAWLFLSRTDERASRGAPPAPRPSAEERHESSAAGSSATLLTPAPLRAPPEPAAREPVAAASEEPPVDSLELTADEALLQIRVLAIENGRPLGGVVLRVEGSADAPRRTAPPVRELVSNAEGRVDCRIAANRECRLRALVGPDSGASSPGWRVSPVPPHEYRTVVLQLFARTDSLWCARVVDAETGAPLPDARVALVERDPLTEPRALFSADTARDGRLRLAFLASRENVVRIESGGYAPRVVAIEPGHATPESEARIELLRAAALEVLLSDAEGAPLAELEVRVSCARAALVAGDESALPGDGAGDPSFSARTDASGRARLDGLPPRTAWMILVRDGGRALRQSVLDPGPEPGRTARLALQLGAGIALTGIALDPSGAPCAGVALWLLPARSGERHLRHSMEERLFLRTLSDEKGCFRFEGVPAGNWFVGPEPVREPLRPSADTVLTFSVPSGPGRTGAFAPVAAEVTLPESGEARDIRLTCWPGLFLRGTVVGVEREGALDAAGAASGFALVSATSADLRASAQAYPDGSFVLGPLAPGRYLVTARERGASSEPLAVQAGAEGLVLRLAPSATPRR